MYIMFHCHMLLQKQCIHNIVVHSYLFAFFLQHRMKKSKLKEQIIIMTMSVWKFISRNEQMHYCDEAFPPFVITSISQRLERLHKIIKSNSEITSTVRTPILTAPFLLTALV